MFIIKNHIDLLQKISFVRLAINQYEVGLGQIGEVHPEAYKFEEKIDELKDLLFKYEEIRDRNTENINQFAASRMDYKVAWLHYIDGLNYKQIAKVLGKSYGYIRGVVCDTKKREKELNLSFRTNQPSNALCFYRTP
ncbi:hypothetical protein [Psychrobacillus sp. L3]|uniref:hypothetical protein n=1 Tax=Psychrobacillus sp. L3 TaxID=3236891 RepID=UPI0036F3E2AA